jgi:hypothetical protein
MKKRYTILAFLLITASTFAQSPEKMSYQAVIRDATNTLLTNQSVGMQISILQTTITGTAVYIETQTATTNINGLVSLEIGAGSTSDNFATIDWSAGPYFIKTETDPAGGSSYTITGTSQIMSVPFALYAKTSGNSEANATNINNNTTAIALNTAKVGYTEAAVSANTAVAANTSKVGYTEAAVSANTAVAANTLKVGYTDALVSANTAVTANTAKVGMPTGTATGQMNYWNSTAWVVVAPGASLPGNQAQTLVFCNGVPTWGNCPAVVPTLSSTTAASAIGVSTASSGGVISDDGGASITARGVAWGTNTSPTISGSYTADGTGTGTFTSSLSGLTGNTTYYVRGYATNSAGTAYGAEVSFITAIVPPFSGNIGDAYQGGKVAYILQSGDPGYVAGEVHGLIAATSDQSTGIIWNNDGTKATRGATGEVIGTGLANTNAIINKQGEPATSYAAGLARAYTGGGYTDWYLPSKEELNKLYINRVAIGGFALVSQSWYWNSTEYNLSSFTFGWCQDFYDGRQDAMNDVTWAVYVRAVRSF